MTTDEHPIDQPISGVDVIDGGDSQGGATYGSYVVGRNCTRIEATHKSGMYCAIPYIRVWDGEKAIGEFCQHNLAGVYFAAPVCK